MKRFPKFVMQANNKVVDTPDETVNGAVFDGADGEQIIFWECEEGGTSPEHSHDFWEYALVVSGTFKGKIGDKEVELLPGDECAIPQLHRRPTMPAMELNTANDSAPADTKMPMNSGP